MTWHEYIACFFAGMFLANVVPHFVHGISGDRFPTPFAKPPGKGLSSPTVNVLWALFNLAVGYILFRAGNVSSGGNAALAIFSAGIAVISIACTRADHLDATAKSGAAPEQKPPSPSRIPGYGCPQHQGATFVGFACASRLEAFATE
jgi:hypothetical protein